MAHSQDDELVFTLFEQPKKRSIMPQDIDRKFLSVSVIWRHAKITLGTARLGERRVLATQHSAHAKLA
jgi:hypothetical protein